MLRIACSNLFETDNEPEAVVDNQISHETFWRMTRCAFLNTAVDEDVMAVLKRAHVIVFGHRRIYMRTAGAAKKSVEVIDYPVGDRELLVPASKEPFGAYKAGEPTSASDKSIEWSRRFVALSMSGQPFNGFKHGLGLDPFTSKTTMIEIKPALDDLAKVVPPSLNTNGAGAPASTTPGDVLRAPTTATDPVPALLAVKEEKAEENRRSWKRALSSMSQSVISLDDSDEDMAGNTAAPSQPMDSLERGLEEMLGAVPASIFDLDDDSDVQIDKDGDDHQAGMSD